MRLLACALAGLLLVAAPAAVRSQDDGQQPAADQPQDNGQQGGESYGGSDNGGAAPAGQQGQDDGGAQGQDDGGAQGQDQGGSPGSDDGGGGGSAGPVTLSEAKDNIDTLIVSFIAQHSVDGTWPLLDKRTKRVRRLKLVKIDDKRVAPAGSSRFAAPAVLKDEATGQTLQASFITDFSGPDWKVVGMRLKEPAAAAAAAKKRKK